jgi:hypothetical protein
VPMRPAPRATRAAVSRALARSRTGRASVKAVLLHPDQVGMPAGAGERCRPSAASCSSSTGSGAMTLRTWPLGVGDAHGDRSPRVSPVATPRGSRRRRARSSSAPPRPCPCRRGPGQPPDQQSSGDTSGHALEHSDQRRTMRLPRGEPAQHGRSVSRGTAPCAVSGRRTSRRALDPRRPHHGPEQQERPERVARGRRPWPGPAHRRRPRRAERGIDPDTSPAQPSQPSARPSIRPAARRHSHPLGWTNHSRKNSPPLRASRAGAQRRLTVR